MADGSYKDEDLMRTLYIEEDRTQREVANELGCHWMTVHRWLKKHGITEGDEKTCSQCGDSYVSTRSDAPDEFCSVECHHADMRVRLEAECDTCGETFSVKESRRDTARFCSHDCRSEWQSEAYQGDGGPGWSGGKETYECRECGEMFEGYTSQRSTKYCSRDCYFAWLRENAPTGEDHPSFLNGERAYGRGWNSTKRRQVRERDGYECQDCGLSNEEHLDELDAKLHVHHIRPHRTFNSDAEANRAENLVALCAYCHMPREAEVWNADVSSPSLSSDSPQSTLDVWSSTGGGE